jgi:hypothetical protein
MRPTLLACTLALFALPAPAQEPVTADAIMSRVAANQDAAQSDRAHYVYIQHAHIASRKGKTIRCEETTDTRITPVPNGSDEKLLTLDGRLLHKHEYLQYTQLGGPKNLDAPNATAPHSAPATPAATPDPDRETSNVTADHKDLNITVMDNDNNPMDLDLVENMRENLTSRHSKDGISPNLFPLTSTEQADYTFRLLGRAPMNGRDCFHIAFSPKDPDDFTWKGDAYIDTTAFQPVLIRTAMSRKLPLAVRMLLGTNVPGLGFTIVYAPQPGTPQPGVSPTGISPADSVWFPTTFGTEFKLRVLFFLNRQITFSADNRDFEKTHVNSQIRSDPTP